MAKKKVDTSSNATLQMWSKHILQLVWSITL